MPRDLGEGLFTRTGDTTPVTLRLAPDARWIIDYYPVEAVRPRERPERLRRPPGRQRLGAEHRHVDGVEQLADGRDHRLQQVQRGRVGRGEALAQGADADRDRRRPPQGPALTAHHLQAAAAEVDRQERVGSAGAEHVR